MSQSLNKLFDALVQSEQAAEAEKNKYQEVKKGIQINTEKLKNETAKTSEITEEMKALESTLDGVETVVEELKYKEVFLEEMTRKVHSENADKINKLANVRDTWKSQSMLLMKQVQEFTGKYGLSSSTREKRLANARSSLKKVIVEVERLQHEIEEKKTRLAAINELFAKRERLGTENQKLASAENDIQVKIREEDGKIHRLQRESLALQEAPEAGAEFSQVNENLDKYKTGKLESRAEELHAQLSSITDELRRQEGQTLRLQYRRWQRLRQTKQEPVNEQQQQSQPDRDCDRDSASALYQRASQLRQDPIEISLDDEIAPATRDSTDRPGLGMSAQTEVFSQPSETDGNIMPSRVVQQISTSPGNLMWQQVVQSCSDFINKDCNKEENQENRGKTTKGNTFMGLFVSHKPQAKEGTGKFTAEEDLLLSPKAAQPKFGDITGQAELNLIFSQDDILCPSASTLSETATRSNKESLEGTSQNTIFISSPD
ncbi:coiled-coil domain-containing protein 172 [Elysia marginata]|uniref:Coiled-coil domain-containing protein 172 n=1 Tax=Elysia marginata TaxID=1093978 RepID=A0AAV4FW49_9GAST|nr:coiled-coil domain-containing protein 172 [Elysia marginata]